MVYVNNDGPITSVNACPQPGKCERSVRDNDPAVVAFHNKAREVLRKSEIRTDTGIQQSPPK